MEQRQSVAFTYNEAFLGRLTTPFVEAGNVSTYAQYALLAKNGRERDALMTGLKEKGIPSMIYYPVPQHTLKVFAGNPYSTGEYPCADKYCATTFSLPMHPYLTESDQSNIIDTVLDILEEG